MRLILGLVLGRINAATGGGGNPTSTNLTDESAVNLTDESGGALMSSGA